MSAPAPRSLLACFLAGLAYAWAETREFVAVFVLLGVIAIGLGAWQGDLAVVFGGGVMLAALVFTCIVYGSNA